MAEIDIPMMIIMTGCTSFVREKRGIDYISESFIKGCSPVYYFCSLPLALFNRI